MAWSNSHRPLPHSQINLCESSQRTAADLVWHTRTALNRTEAAGMLQGTSSPRHALLSLCAKHALTPDVHTQGSLVGSVQEEHRWRKWKENMAEMKTLMAQTTSRLWSPLAAECFGKLWKADFGLRHTPSIHTQTLKSRPWLQNPWQASQHYVRHMSVLYCANRRDCN